ncbi:MAG: amidohydrolase family protein [Deltaproteobacteria bacterium]|nr:amidohydrolase family protein [Deltaproteobacteria bacterium]
MDRIVIDSHIHCGVQNVSWGWEGIRPLLEEAGIRGAGLIPPVEDIYDRYDYNFTDTPAWQACRRAAHRYLRELNDPEIEISRYFFVWNDFAYEDLGSGYVAVKWHRHANEPEYHYDDPRCREFLEVVQKKGLPILLEETFANTLLFAEKLLPPQVPLIIPHLGGLNGGYAALERTGLFALPYVHADTALASRREIEDYLGRYGSGRLFFGSDYPFGHPAHELAKVTSLNLPSEQLQAVLADNFRRVCRLGEREKVASDQ